MRKKRGSSARADKVRPNTASARRVVRMRRAVGGLCGRADAPTLVGSIASAASSISTIAPGSPPPGQLVAERVPARAHFQRGARAAYSAFFQSKAILPNVDDQG